MKKLTAEWVRKAEGDWETARVGAAQPKPVRDTICFHCQQGAEKYLKALIQEAGLPITRTHELEELLDDLLPRHRELRSLRRGVIFLSDFAVEVRYPGRNATTRQMRAALRWAGRTRQTCPSLAGHS